MILKKIYNERIKMKSNNLFTSFINYKIKVLLMTEIKFNTYNLRIISIP